jgi:hypothetical protein
MNPAVQQVFDSYPVAARRPLLELRRQIHELAREVPGVGPLTETLKWGEPAYLTSASHSGTTIRIAWKPGMPDHYSVFLHCRTTLIEDCRGLFPELNCIGNREIRLSCAAPVPAALRECLLLALTYHKPALRGERRKASRP